MFDKTVVETRYTSPAAAARVPVWNRSLTLDLPGAPDVLGWVAVLGAVLAVDHWEGISTSQSLN